MNYFDYQDKTNKKILTMVSKVIIVYAILIALLNLILFLVLPPTLFLLVAITLSLFIVALISISTFRRFSSLRQGGVSLALLMKATPLLSNTQEVNEKQLLHAVNTLSLATGLLLSKVYVLKDEKGINLLMAGMYYSDMVLIVTQGALEQFTFQEWQSVLAFHYRQWLNTSNQTGFQLIPILAGFRYFGPLGRWLSRKLKRDMFFSAITMAQTMPLYSLEQSAEMKAVLQKIKNHPTHSALNHSFSEEINHLCFDSFLTNALLSQNSIEAPMIKENAINAIFTTETSISATSLLNAIGQSTQQSIMIAEKILDSLSEPLQQACHDPKNVQLLYYAIMLSSNPTNYAQGMQMLNQLLPRKSTSIIESLYKEIQTTPLTLLFPIVLISLHAFCQNTSYDRRNVHNVLQSLYRINDEYHFKCLLIGIIGKHVDEHTVQVFSSQDYTIHRNIQPIQKLFSFLVNFSSHDKDTLDSLFEVTLNSLTDKAPGRIPLDELDPSHILNALKKINLLNSECKRNTIKSCTHCLQHDETLSLYNAMIIQIILLCLDCPIPMIMTSAPKGETHAF